MSTATYDGRLDLSQTPKIPTGRLVKVELRKMVDTRAGRWLLGAVAVASLLAVVLFGLNASAEDRTFLNFMGFTASPQGFILPVLGILLVTSEWSQRTAMVTFVLTPHRGRVLSAKVAAALVLGLLAILVAVVLGLLATTMFGGTDAYAGIGGDDFAKFGLLQLTAVLQGLAFGLLFLNSAAAIVSYFILPTAFSIVANVWGALSEQAAWFDLSTAQTPLFEGQNLTGEQWAQLATAILIWVVLPFAAGLWRVLRAEVK